MRIISGKYKSRRVNSSAPEKEDNSAGGISSFRPTTDRAKETLFNVLNNILDFDKIECLDLFAGSGALGFEALSRGGDKCDFVESSPKQAAMIKKTAGELGCEGDITIYNEDVLRFLKMRPGAAYDLIFADPPFAYDNYAGLINEVMLLKFGIFVLEHATDIDIKEGEYNTNEYDVTEKKVGAITFKIFVSKN